MSEFHYDTYCGLYCGACDMMQAYRKGLESGVEPSWENINFPLKKHYSSEPIVCHGCKSDTVFKGCAICPIRKCARKMENIKTCLDCRRYPCFRHGLVDLVRRVTGMKRKLPHLSEIPRNIQTIREKGVAVWLEEQKKLWSCPSCGADFSWYERTCPNCKRDIREQKRYRF